MEQNSIYEKFIGIKLHTEKKGKFNYASWTNAWQAVLEYYPTATYKFHNDVIFYPDKTAEVKVSVTIDGLEREMTLPVMNNYNKAIQNPDAFDINTAKMRCLVKCLAMFGLGMYVYQGEDLPNIESEESKEQGKSSITDLKKAIEWQTNKLMEFVAEDDSDGLKTHINTIPNDLKTALWKTLSTEMKKTIKQMIGE